MANFSIGQRITARGEDFMVVTHSHWIMASGLSKHVDYNWNEMNKKELTNHLMNQRSLLYVAITRAMQMVRITGVGEKSELL